MQSLIESLREIIGVPEFYVRLGGSTNNYNWDYGAMIEYFGCLLLVLIVVSSVFKLLLNWSK